MNDQMKTYAALLRGINVGGKNRLPMKDLIVILQQLGLENIHTYIQSGNIVFQHQNDIDETLSNMIQDKIEEQFGFRPQVLLLDERTFLAALQYNPFSDVEEPAKIVHLYFLSETPTAPDLEKLEALKKDSEQYVLRDRVFYLYAPEGIGRSKLAVQAEKALVVQATARNWRTCEAIQELILTIRK